MPIRSPRGRAAAYRALWQWPLRSPARLALTVAVVLAVAIGVSAAMTALAGPPAPPVPGSAAASSTATAGPRATAPQRTPAPTALPPVTPLEPSALPVADAAPEALAVAARWTTAWLRPADGTSAAQWLAGLAPHTTDEYLGVLGTVDPANIPATRVTSGPRAVRAAPSSVDVEVATDALTLRVLVVRTPDGDWRVAGYDRAGG